MHCTVHTFLSSFFIYFVHSSRSSCTWTYQIALCYKICGLFMRCTQSLWNRIILCLKPRPSGLFDSPVSKSNSNWSPVYMFAVFRDCLERFCSFYSLPKRRQRGVLWLDDYKNTLCPHLHSFSYISSSKCIFTENLTAAENILTRNLRPDDIASLLKTFFIH